MLTQLGPKGNMKCRGVLSVVVNTPAMHIPPWYWFRKVVQGIACSSILRKRACTYRIANFSVGDPHIGVGAQPNRGLTVPTTYCVFPLGVRLVAGETIRYKKTNCVHAGNSPTLVR